MLPQWIKECSSSHFLLLVIVTLIALILPLSGTESYKTSSNETETLVSISSGLFKRGLDTFSTVDTSQTAFSLVSQQVGPRISMSSFNPLRPDAR